MLDENITSDPGIRKLKSINCLQIVDTSEYQYLFWNIHEHLFVNSAICF